MSESSRERRAERQVAAAFVVTAVAAIGLGIVYAKGGQPQLEGLFLAVSLGSLGVGMVIWGNRLLPQGPVEEEREVLVTTDEEKDEFEASFVRGGEIKRRKLLTRMLGLAGVALAGAFFFPIRSLGPGPGGSLKRTAWKDGVRVVDEEGHPVKVDALPVGGSLTVFPEGHTKDGDAPGVLLRVEEGLITPLEGREDWAPDGFLLFSKICTHAGCPVGLYQVDTQQLICPCHQSAFDVLEGARPVFGPATRRLPQLPLEIGAGGELKAKGDFAEPVGPNSWTIP